MFVMTWVLPDKAHLLSLVLTCSLFYSVSLPCLDHGPQSCAESTRQRETQILEEIHERSETEEK